MNKESSGVSSAGSSFSSACGTGVQGCQDEATEGVLQRALFSSPGGRPLHRKELGPPEKLEQPERVQEMDLEKEISYKNEMEEGGRRKKNASKNLLTPFTPYPRKGCPCPETLF